MPAGTWTSFSLDGIWETESATLPLNECPVTDIQVCEDNACATVLEEASGLRITETAGVFALEVDKSVIDADPELTRYIKVISHSVEIIEEFSIFLLDCITDQAITLDGEAVSPIVREIPKNDGLQSLLSAEEVAAFFTVSDTRPECAITDYILYKSDTDALTAADTDLYGRLDGVNYADDGAVSIDTEIE